MLILILNFLLFSNAVTLRRDKSILFARTAIISLLFTSFLAYDSLYIIPLSKGIDLYGGLFNATTYNLSINIYIFLVSGAILAWYTLSNRTECDANTNNWDWENILTVIAYTIMITAGLLNFRFLPCGFARVFDMYYLVPLISATGVSFLYYLKKVHKGEHTLARWEIPRVFSGSIVISCAVLILVYYISNDDTLAYYAALTIPALREIFGGFSSLSNMFSKDSAKIPAGVNEEIPTDIKSKVKGKVKGGGGINLFMEGKGGSSSNTGNSSSSSPGNSRDPDSSALTRYQPRPAHPSSYASTRYQPYPIRPSTSSIGNYQPSTTNNVTPDTRLRKLPSLPNTPKPFASSSNAIVPHSDSPVGPSGTQFSSVLPPIVPSDTQSSDVLPPIFKPVLHRESWWPHQYPSVYTDNPIKEDAIMVFTNCYNRIRIANNDMICIISKIQKFITEDSITVTCGDNQEIIITRNSDSIIRDDRVEEIRQKIEKLDTQFISRTEAGSQWFSYVNSLNRHFSYLRFNRIIDWDVQQRFNTMQSKMTEQAKIIDNYEKLISRK